MSTISVEAPVKNGQYLSVLPANSPADRRVGPFDAAVITFFMFGLSGLILMLLLN